jgi:alpha-galactosidase
MGTITRSYIVRETAYFEDTEENLASAKKGEIEDMIIDDYSLGDDWMDLGDVFIEDGNEEELFAKDVNVLVTDTEGNELFKI